MLWGFGLDFTHLRGRREDFPPIEPHRPRPNGGNPATARLNWDFRRTHQSAAPESCRCYPGKTGTGSRMSQDSRSAAPLFTQVDIGAAAPTSLLGLNPPDEHTRLMRDMLAAQDRQNELLEELVAQLSAPQRQRVAELAQWKQANPRLAKGCRIAAEALSKVQSEFLQTLTDEVAANADDLADGDFVFNEFIDRFGPRLAHLNGVIQVLAQLSSAPNPTNNS